MTGSFKEFPVAAEWAVMEGGLNFIPRAVMTAGCLLSPEHGRSTEVDAQALDVPRQASHPDPKKNHP